jgi:hypothetical protein
MYAYTYKCVYKSTSIFVCISVNKLMTKKYREGHINICPHKYMYMCAYIYI